MSRTGGLGMDKSSEYLSVKIGIIVAGVYAVLSLSSFKLTPTFLIAALISSVLWRVVWNCSATTDMPAYKRRTIFWIHVAASAISPVIGVFLANYTAVITA